jgi:hypothetical protein
VCTAPSSDDEKKYLLWPIAGMRLQSTRTTRWYFGSLRFPELTRLRSGEVYPILRTGPSKVITFDTSINQVVRSILDAYFSFESFLLELGFRVQSGDAGGSSARASPSQSGGSKLSVARVLFQTALPRESCSTLPLRPSW